MAHQSLLRQKTKRAEKEKSLEILFSKLWRSIFGPLSYSRRVHRCTNLMAQRSFLLFQLSYRSGFPTRFDFPVVLSIRRSL
jgi:hypothetical protein